MKVKYLYIVTLGDDEELGPAIIALSKKYNQSKYSMTLVVKHLPCSVQFGSTGLELLKDKKFSHYHKFLKGNDTVSLPENTGAHEVGAYLMFHYSSSMLQSVYNPSNEKGGIAVKDVGMNLGKSFAVTMQKVTGKVPIGRVSLLACSAAQECTTNIVKTKGYEVGDSLAKWFAYGMKESYHGWSNPPLVAAWDDFVTVCGVEGVLNDFKHDVFKDFGRKVTTGEGTTRNNKGKVWGNSEDGHKRKWIWVWDSGSQSYEKKSVVGSEWSVYETKGLSVLHQDQN